LIAVDTSVAVAAALSWHHEHAAAVAALPRRRVALIAHVGIETYSVLTRLPPPQRVPPKVAHAYIRKTFETPPLTLPGEGYEELLDLAASARIAGGAIYDALVGATARHAGAALLTLDHRAAGTYQIVGAAYRLI
jgi:predicted nucleic acid-binding protein